MYYTQDHFVSYKGRKYFENIGILLGNIVICLIVIPLNDDNNRNRDERAYRRLCISLCYICLLLLLLL